ncbi:hypothetical protein [Nonomuraea zeae]|uniref:Uncharacterized protein n=1 Tax=Nonomuraea zeae TaxID=1642303 RepID=A0A5S4FX33_9ACTN|nr:hypothetical protein [Nonomuraea zeae]TMR24834.1 hypothetical protein ETD85_46045 [Nonomuraea zeae]
MPTSSGKPPHRSQTLRYSTNRVERLAAKQAATNATTNAATNAATSQVKVDSAFFQRVRKLIQTHGRPAHAMVTVSGLTIAGGALVLAAIGNAADPQRYFSDRSMWNEMLGDLKLSAWDVWISYFSQISPYWEGHASETVQRYLRFELIGMFDELGRVATEMSGLMSSLAWDVTEYDVKLVTLLVSAGTAYKTLLPFSATPGGKLTLGLAAVAFLGLLAALLQEFVGKVKSLDGKLETLGHKIFELEGLFSVGQEKLHLQPPGYDVGLWEPITKEATS